MHLALWCMAGLSVLGAVVSFARPKHAGHHLDEQAAPAEAGAPTEVAAA
jgi:hypothetical protein